MHALYHENSRPQFHFTAKRGWLNDPNGLVYFDGEYHLFFQHNPHGVTWGNMTWGHAVSRDLLHWRQLEHAILPDSQGTIFSGSAVVDHDNTAGFGAGALVCIYTAAGGTSVESSAQPFTQCLAISTDGRTFTKYAGNPVLPHIVGENRDPKVVWHAPTRRWIMTLYLEQHDFAFFASPNLTEWTHLQTIAAPGCEECPDFFPMPVDGDPAKIKWVWTAANARYLVGEFDGTRFVPDEPEARLLAGEHYYAVQTFCDLPDGRRIQMGWLRGLEYLGMPFNQQLSVPVELTLRTTDSGLRLCAAPVRELETLRVWMRSCENTALTPDAPFAMPRRVPHAEADGSREPAAGADLPAAGYEVHVAVAIGKAKQIEFTLCSVTLSWERATQLINGMMPLPAHDGAIRFRALVDRVSVELFADDGAAMLVTGRVAGIDEPPVSSIIVRDGVAKLEQLVVYGLRGIWRTTEGTP